jgi:hypothetical protein
MKVLQFIRIYKFPLRARHWWLMPVILATQEAEIKLPAWAVCETLSWKNLSQKRAGGMAQGVGPEFKPQYYKNKN